MTGASSGIGREFCKELAAQGADLVLVARTASKLEELAGELRSTGVSIHVVPTDLSQTDSPDAIASQLSERDIAVDVLVNNAGFGALGKFADLETKRQINMVRVSITALTHLTRLFMPGMLRRKSGAILNVVSTAGFQPGPNMAVYYATKAFVLSFSEGIAEEVRGSGVRVCCLAPSATKTSFGEDSGMEGSLIMQIGTMIPEAVANCGLKSLAKRKTLVVPGWKNKFTAFSVRLPPRFLVRRLVKALQKT